MIYQGHRYLYEGYPVLALESADGGLVRVRNFSPDVTVIQLGPAFYADSARMKPEPMKYHANQIPGDTE